MFSEDMFPNLKNYIYKLIDPRDGSVFYVGRGVGNRVYSHAKANLSFENDDSRDEISEKLRIIRDIRNSNLEPSYIIHRHGLTLDEAKLAESILIDATPGLTNIMGGEGSSDFGPAHPQQLIDRYSMPEMAPDKSHNLLLINVNKSKNERASLYDSVRMAWRINLDRAKNSDYVLAISQGVCLGVFVPEKWLVATSKNFPGHVIEDNLKRIGFVGYDAPSNIQNMYSRKRLPESMKAKRGAASPVRYFFYRENEPDQAEED